MWYLMVSWVQCTRGVDYSRARRSDAFGGCTGCEPLIMMGLAGMGDLVLTCTGNLSRNRRVGLALGAGQTLEEILDELGEVAEGVRTTKRPIIWPNESVGIADYRGGTHYCMKENRHLCPTGPRAWSSRS